MSEPGPSMRMLVIDDEEAVLFALREYFTPMGYEVRGARSVEEAEALLDAEGYAVILADLCLGGMDGNEGLHIARRVRRRDPAIRIVILTAYGSPEAEAEARRVGVDTFLHKPQPLRELTAIVRKLTVPREVSR